MTYWPHAPLHVLSKKGVYMVTSATYDKINHFNNEERLKYLHENLLMLANDYKWKLQAWAVLSNHYHFIPESPEKSSTLVSFLSHLHVNTAKFINNLDGTPNRRVWWQYWDSLITYPYSYFARLNYVNQNAVKHGVVKIATHYQWCSANWFEQTANPSFRKTIASFKTDNVKVIDDF